MDSTACAHKKRRMDGSWSIPKRHINIGPEQMNSMVLASPHPRAVLSTCAEFIAPGRRSGINQSTCKASRPKSTNQVAEMRSTTVDVMVFADGESER